RRPPPTQPQAKKPSVRWFGKSRNNSATCWLPVFRFPIFVFRVFLGAPALSRPRKSGVLADFEFRIPISNVAVNWLASIVSCAYDAPARTTSRRVPHWPIAFDRVAPPPYTESHGSTFQARDGIAPQRTGLQERPACRRPRGRCHGRIPQRSG